MREKYILADCGVYIYDVVSKLCFLASSWCLYLCASAQIYNGDLCSGCMHV